MAIWARHAWLSCVAASWWAGVLGADSQRREWVWFGRPPLWRLLCEKKLETFVIAQGICN